MQTMNAPKYEAIAEADAWLVDAGLPSYSKLRAILWRIAVADATNKDFVQIVQQEARVWAEAATPSA